MRKVADQAALEKEKKQKAEEELKKQEEGKTVVAPTEGE